jgi:GNAT superfamily N-acetyltransferase
VTSPALSLRRAIESFHSVCYFAPEAAQPYLDAGLHPWNAYFAQRAAPLGAVSEATVTSTFYNFSPLLVARSIPAVWDQISPAEATTLRIAGAVEAIRRLVPDLPPDSVLSEVGDIIRTCNRQLEFAGRPLAAAHQAIVPPDDPLASLWWAVAVLREYRGDGHVAALVTEAIGPVEALVTSRGFGDMSVESYRRGRGWPREAWHAAVEHCRSNGWIDANEDLTETGRELRERIEARTDSTVAPAMRAIGGDLDRVIEVIKPISRTIYRNGGVGEKQN